MHTTHTLPPIRSWLYAPGNNPKLLERVFTAGADGVILDLEDAVPLAEKAHARELVADTIRNRAGQPGPLISVRVNHPETGRTSDDIAAVVQPGVAVIRLPKMERPDTVREIDALVGAAEADAGLPPGGIALICGIETALGVWNALEIAQASPRVLSLGFGEIDFIRDVNATRTESRTETLHARSRLVLASRVAGIRPPSDSVYPHLQDDAGFTRTTQEAQALGFFGRSAIHPRQLATIHAVFTPAADEIAWAQTVIAAAAQAEATGSGAVQLPGGEFVDIPVVQRAQHILDLAAAIDASRT